jgi:hypothetical protein
VAGNGGYYNLSQMKTDAKGNKPAPGQQTEPDGQGNTITLSQFNDSDYGFLRITVNATSLQVTALAVSGTPTTTSPTTPIPAPTIIDQFLVNLAKHTISTPQAKSRGKKRKPAPQKGKKEPKHRK